MNEIASDTWIYGQIASLVSTISSGLFLITYYYAIHFKATPASFSTRLMSYVMICIFCLMLDLSFSFVRPSSGSIGCDLLAAIIVFFGSAGVFWMNLLAFTVYYTVAKQASKTLEIYYKWYHLFVWILAIIFVIVTWSSKSYSHFSYFCFISNSYRWVQLFFFLPMTCCLIANIIIFIFFVRTAHKKFSENNNNDANNSSSSSRLRVELWLYVSLILLLGLPLIIVVIYTITLLIDTTVEIWQISLWYILANCIGLWLSIVNSINMGFFKISFWCAPKKLSQDFSSGRQKKQKPDEDNI